MPPFAAPPSGNRDRPGGKENGRNTGNGGYSSGPGIFVRPHVGFGVLADFDPETGALQASPGATGPHGGVYGDLAGVPVVFYRTRSGLALRVGDRPVDLEADVTVEWAPLARRTTRFVVTVEGTVVCDLTYRSMPADMDLGLLIRDVHTNPTRRTDIFSD